MNFHSLVISASSEITMHASMSNRRSERSITYFVCNNVSVYIKTNMHYNLQSTTGIIILSRKQNLINIQFNLTIINNTTNIDK